jgi:hypothetical protein
MFMKSALAAVALIAILSLTTVAQNTATPSLVASHHADAATAKGEMFSWGPPPSGPNILFYGGDVNPTDPNVQGFPNGNTLLVPNTTTYGAVRVPTNGHFVVTGVFFNQVVSQSGDVFDPTTATYDFRTGLSSGNGGASIASGGGPQGARKTGRMPFGYVEYQTAVALTSPMTAPNGEIIWVNESPQCTDSNNSICVQLQYFVDNTTQKTGSVNGGAQPTGQMFFNSAFFGFTWTNWCDPSLGQDSQMCADLSFGIYGHR